MNKNNNQFICTLFVDKSTSQQIQCQCKIHNKNEIKIITLENNKTMYPMKLECNKNEMNINENEISTIENS